MIYPPGAIRTTEEMLAMIGKPVYMPLPNATSIIIPRISPYIVKFHPIRVVINNLRPNAVHNYFLETEEAVDAAKMYAISVRNDWSSSWGADPVFFFSNFWHAYAYVQHAENLRV